MTITVRARGGGSVSDARIKVNIVDLSGSDPPNPTANDRNDSFALTAMLSPLIRTAKVAERGTVSSTSMSS